MSDYDWALAKRRQQEEERQRRLQEIGWQIQRDEARAKARVKGIAAGTAPASKESRERTRAAILQQAKKDNDLATLKEQLQGFQKACTAGALHPVARRMWMRSLQGRMGAIQGKKRHGFWEHRS